MTICRVAVTPQIGNVDESGDSLRKLISEGMPLKWRA